MAEQATIGFAIATFARSQLAGLGAGIALYFVEQFSTLFLPDIVRYLPFHVASSALRVTSTGARRPARWRAARSTRPSRSCSCRSTSSSQRRRAALIVERAEVTG